MSQQDEKDATRVPPSQQTSYHVDKKPVVAFDRSKLLRCMEDQAKAQPDWPESVPYTKQTRENKFVVRQHTAPGGGNGRTNSVDTSAVVKSTFSQPRYSVTSVEPPNTTNIEENITLLGNNSPTLTQLNLNNIQNISSEQFQRLFNALANNTHLQNLFCANTQLSNSMAEPLLDCLRSNRTLRLINLESNILTGAFVVRLMQVLLECENSTVSTLRLTNQRQRLFGTQIEQEIATIVTANPRLMRLSMDFANNDIHHRVSRHLQANLDCLTRQRRQGSTVSSEK